MYKNDTAISNLPKFLVALSLFLSTSVFLSSFALAQGDNRICDPERQVFTSAMNSIPTSLKSTKLLSTLTDSMTSIWFMTMGADMVESMNCLDQFGASIPNGPTGASSTKTALMSQGCSGTAPRICDGINNQFLMVDGSFDREGFASNKTSGSLLGFANLVTNTAKYEPVPVNTAYFFKDYAAKLPIVGDRVFAQTTYGHTLIDTVLVIWKIFRNIAYALMSVIMLWIGFAIVTRKRISAQTVVNIQYALPKVVIALILIAFSYPIGALITSLAWTLFNNSQAIITSISGSAGFADMWNMGFGAQMVIIVALIIGSAGAGPLLGVVAMMVALCIGFYMFAYLKAMWIYLKMIVSTALSPLQVALYALPGQDDKLSKWLNQMLAWGIGIFGMKMVIDLTQVVFWTVLANQFEGVTQGVFTVGGLSAIAGSLYVVFLGPMILLFGFGSAIKVPTLIEDALLGPKNRR